MAPYDLYMFGLMAQAFTAGITFFITGMALLHNMH